jgi:hypothetical protein
MLVGPRSHPKKPGCEHGLRTVGVSSLLSHFRAKCVSAQIQVPLAHIVQPEHSTI